MKLPAAYLEEMRLLLGETEYENYRKSMEEESVLGLRFNSLKVSGAEREPVLHKVFAGEAEEPVPWSLGEGYYYKTGGRERTPDVGGSPGKHPYHYAGLYYLQEPSAMAPAAMFSIEPGDKVLDLCAAPGGKSTALGAGLLGTGLLLSNDRSVSRAKGLLKNIERFGIGNCLVTAEEPERLAACFPEYFDKVLVDAPCSGEGMFRRDASMASDWEARGPEYYGPIQRELLLLASRMVKPGGRLLYSTCTFSEWEDEGAVQWLLREAPSMESVALPAEHGFVRGKDGISVRLFPWKLKGEGHFLSLFQKKGCETSDGTWADGRSGHRHGEGEGAGRDKRNGIFLERRKAFAEFCKKILVPLEERGYYWERDGELYLLPVDPEELPPLRYLRTGLHLGTMKRERFEPSQALAMYLKKEEFASTVDFPWEDMRTVKYLKGETITEDGAFCTGEDGWCLVCTDGWPLGFAKRGKGILKNKYDAGWRWI